MPSAHADGDGSGAAYSNGKPAPGASPAKKGATLGKWVMLHLALCAIGMALFVYWNSFNPHSFSFSLTPSSHSSSAVPDSQLQPTEHLSARTGLRFHSTPYDPAQLAQLRWGIIFDAGSTGSRVHIYRFRLDDALPAPQLEDEIFVEVKPGLSAFVPQGVGHDANSRNIGAGAPLGMGPDAAAESLRPLMELCVEQIPASAHKNTPISLRATAGLRLLGTEASEAILASIRVLFASYPFPFAHADVEVMGGSEEGVFAWLTVNYLTGMLREQKASRDDPKHANGPAPRDHPPTAAILDLGGASTQIVFEPDFDSWSALQPAQQSNLYTLPYGENKYFLYETSYLGYGLMEARRRGKLNLLAHPSLQARPLHAHAHADASGRVHYHPCVSDAHEETLEHEGESHTLRGHAQGHASCAGLVRTLFPKHPHHHCPTEPFCSFAGHFALPLRDFDHGIYAFSYFYDRTLDLFELEEESESEPDGTVLRLHRLRELAERVCSFSAQKQEVRAIGEVEAEKEAGRLALEAAVAQRRAQGCSVVRVRDAQGNVRDMALDADGQHVHQHTVADAAAPSSAVDEEQLDGQCMIEEKPDLSREAEQQRQKMSSQLAAMISENPYLCFDLTYAHTLLHYGYDLPEHTPLHIMKRLQKKEVGWCLGAMLHQMATRGWGDAHADAAAAGAEAAPAVATQAQSKVEREQST